MASEISIQAKLAAAVTAGTVSNTTTSATFDSIKGTATAAFEHRSTPCAASSAKTVLPTGSVTINDAAKYFWVYIRNVDTVDAVNIYIEYGSGTYAQCACLPADASGKGSMFLTRMVGAASTYPRIAFASANSATTPIVETIVCDA